MTHDILALPVRSLAERFQRGTLPARAILDAHLAQIEAVNPRINAVVQMRVAAARGEADALDRVEDRSSLGPLAAVPFTVKDNFLTDGLVTAIGVPERAGVVPDRDAVAVARAKGAGALLMGKTNCPPWGAGIETDNEVYGLTVNPHDASRTAGGSSGGEAAIVASAGSAFGLGSDSGGSGRLPAHFCGVCALKPTATAISVEGIVDDDGAIGAISDPRTQVTILARRVDDLGVVFDAIAGPAQEDPWVPPIAPRAGASDVAGLRVATYVHDGISSPTEDTEETIAAAAAALKDHGVHVGEARPPEGGFELTREVWRSYVGRMSSADLYVLLRRWEDYRRAMNTFLEPFDAILCPTYECPAPPHGHTRNEGISYTLPYSLTGWPCVVVPFGRSPEGLPIGVQVVAGPWREDVALALGARLESATET